MRALICESIPYAPLPDEARPSGNLRFLGDILANASNSAGAFMIAVEVLVGEVDCSRYPSIARSQGPGEADSASGDGSGVISARGPTPGEETVEPGERESTLDRECAPEIADPTLALRTRRPAFSRIVCGASSTTANGALEEFSLLDGSTEAALVSDSKAAPWRISGGGDTIVGCVCGGEVSRT